MLNIMGEKLDDYLGEIFQNVDPILYHYTNDSGLLGILKTEKLWLTDIRFLNDPDEQSNGLAKSQIIIMERLLENLNNDKWSSDSLEDIILNRLVEALKSTNNIANRFPAHCISFCGEADLLTQWKGYANYGSGFSIGFDTKVLFGLVNRSRRSYIGRVVYKDEIKKKLIDRVIDLALSQKDDYKKEGDFEFLSPYISLLTTLSYFMKSDYFAGEEEIRCIFLSKRDYGNLTINHRVSPIGIVPYFEVDISPLNRIVKGICIGPKMDEVLNKISLSDFVDTNLITKSSNRIR